MLLAISFFCLFVSFFNLAISLWAIIEVRSFQKSTHNVQFVPAEDAAKEDPLDIINKEMEKDFDNVL